MGREIDEKRKRPDSLSPANRKMNKQSVKDSNKDLSHEMVGVILAEYEKNLILPKKLLSCQFFLCSVGLVGAGKTTVLKPLSKKLSLIRISADEMREILKKYGYNYKKDKKLTFQIIKKYARQGYNIAIDSDCVTKRKEIEKIAHQVGAKIIWIHINPPEKFIIKKLRNLKYRPNGIFKDSERAVKNYLARKPLHRNLNFPFLYTLDTSRGDLARQISELSAIIRKISETSIH